MNRSEECDMRPPTIFVTPAGVASIFRPAPRSRMGVHESVIVGYTIAGFVPLCLEPWLREALWQGSSAKYQQLQITAS